MIDPSLIQALKVLALQGAHRDFVEIRTLEIGKLMGVSQQTASRRLRELIGNGFLEEKRFGRILWVRITPKGLDVLKKEMIDYGKIFDVTDNLELTGEVISGLGEGKYYISKEGYREQIKEKLFFDPFPGTLNVRVYAKDIKKVELLRTLPGICLCGFVSEGRTFGNVKAFFCTINGIDAALIMPERSHYTDIVEIISDKNLREELSLEDGSIVNIIVYP